MELIKCLMSVEKEIQDSFKIKSLGLKTAKVEKHLEFLKKLTKILEFNNVEIEKFNAQFARMIFSTHAYLNFKDSHRDQLRSFERQVRTLILKSNMIKNSDNLPDGWHRLGLSNHIDIVIDNLYPIENFFACERKRRRNYQGMKVAAVKKMRIIGELYNFYIKFINFKVDKKMKLSIQNTFNEMKFDNVTSDLLIKVLITESANVFFDIKSIKSTTLSKIIHNKDWMRFNPF